jgi:hypothetical protein
MSDLANKILSCCIFFLTFLCLAGNSHPSTLSFHPSDPDVTIGDSFEIDVVISGLEYSDLSAFDIDVLYDHTLMEFEDYHLGDALGDIDSGDAWDLSLGKIAEGQIDLSELSFLSDFRSQPDAFTLATLSFVGTHLGTADLWFSENFSLSDSDEWGSPLTADLGAGSVAIHPVPEPGSLVLLGSGLIALAGWRRKRQL